MIIHFVLSVAAGSKLEQAIGEGVDALNAYISSGEIEELRDVIPQPNAEESENNDDENGDDDEMPDSKRPKVDRIVNHNPQIIYNNNDQPMIPSLMALDVKVDKDGSSNWGPSSGFSKSSSHQPPSLLNLNVAPPFDDLGSGSTGGSGGGSSGGGGGGGGWHGPKRRNRDSDGNRISRFDREGGSRSSRFENNDSGGGGSGGGRRNRSGNSGSSRQERSGRSNRRI